MSGLGEHPGFTSSVMNGATIHYRRWNGWQCSRCVPLRTTSTLLWRSQRKVKLVETVLSEIYFFFPLNITLGLERKSQSIPNHLEVRGVDRRALCNTELCGGTESLIFIGQHCPGSLANVVILFPSYMQHFPVAAQSHDQTLTQSDSAHRRHSAGLRMGTAAGIHTPRVSKLFMNSLWGAGRSGFSNSSFRSAAHLSLMYYFPAMGSL